MWLHLSLLLWRLAPDLSIVVRRILSTRGGWRRARAKPIRQKSIEFHVKRLTEGRYGQIWYVVLLACCFVLLLIFHFK